METQDPFETGAPGGAEIEDDPFAGVEPDAAAEVAQEPVAEATEPGGEPPLVDREGQPAEPPAETPQEPSAAPEEGGEPAAPGEPAQPPEQPQTVDPDDEQEPPAPDPAGQQAPAPQQGAQAGSNGTTGPRGGKGEPRHYKVLYQTGDKQWAEHPLTDVPEGVNVVTVEGEQWVEARNNDHATRIGFAILGSPAQGVTVWPVPKGAYKPKRVKPAPPAPERTRLSIS